MKDKMTSGKFVADLMSIRDYWLNLGKSKEETVDGFLFSIFSYIDGESGMNDCQFVALSCDKSKNFNQKDYLHEIYCAMRQSDKNYL